MTRRLSSLECLLSVMTSVLLICCVGLIVVSWISLKPEGTVDPAVLIGRMVITDGAEFSEELNNSSSLQFKSLAFDVQNLVSDAFRHSELRSLFKSCQVSSFSRGSVVVTFDLLLYQLISVMEVEQQLGAGLQMVTPTGLVIDRNSIQITEKQEETTATPTTAAPATAAPTTIAPTTAAPTTTAPTTAAPTTAAPTTTAPTTAAPTTAAPTTTTPTTAAPTTAAHTTTAPTTAAPSTATPTTAAPTTTAPTNQQKLTCTFEQGMCLWQQQQDSDDGPWIRTNGSTFPPQSGPSVDHTLGNNSGFYVVTPRSPGQWLKSFKLYSLPLTPTTEPACLSFWYHMFGKEVHRLSVLLLQPAVTTAFQKDGNYGDNWNYGQVTLNLTTQTTVVFEALKKGGVWNDIALDDITLTSKPCGPAPPEPTNVPPPPTTPPIPADCGGPFDLWEPNSTFSSPNYPQSYGNKADCLWTLHTGPGRNIRLHFLDFDVEATLDFVEVRDGVGPSSTLLAVLTGNDGPAHDLFSTANQMTVWFFTNDAGYGRGFRANFTSGVNLGSPAPCAVGQFQCQTGSCIHGNGQCDGVVNCPDASDEADCVKLQVNGSSPLQFQIVSSLFTVCADSWNSHLSVFTCQYLGYRFGEATLLPARPQDSPFVNVTVTNNGTLETSVSGTCSRHKVISLNCNNQPCGVRQVINDTRETDQSAKRTPGQGVVRVVGGVNAAKGAWPWIVSLHWRGRHACGASVIGRDWLLTAAHCVYGKSLHLQAWTAVFGLHAQSDLNSLDLQTRRVDHIVIHRHYNRRTKEADIAMMHLQQPINFTESIQPVCLPAAGQDITPGRKCFIAGWGRDAEGYLPDVLQQAQVPLVDQVQCQRWLPEYNITSSMFCAGYAEGGVDSCQGDSGGPLMCLDDGRWTVIGVTSFGIGCGHPQRPGVYARVSAFTSWIAQTRRSTSSSSSS